MIVHLVVWVLAFAPHAVASTIGPADMPAPLRSKDLRKWIADVKPSDAQRVAMERAFDACVDQWTVLRDQSVRPAQAKLDAKADDDAAAAAWRTTMARAFETTRGTERAMFDAMRAAGLNTEQTAALDRDADARTRARAGAVLGGVRVNLPRVPGLKELPADTQTAIDQKLRAWEVSATPVIDRLATASLDDKAADRAADLKRKLLASQRSTVRDIATLLPAPQAAQYLQSFRRQSLPSGLVWGGFGAPSPMSMRNSLDPTQHQAALEKVDDWEKQREAMEEAAIEAMLSDSFTAETMAQMESQYSKLNSDRAADIAAAAGMPELNASGDGVIHLAAGAEGIDLSELTGGDGTMVFSSSSITSDGPDGGDLTGVVASKAIVMVRGEAGGDAVQPNVMQATTIQVIATGDGEPIDLSVAAPTTNAIASAVVSANAVDRADGVAAAPNTIAGDDDLPMPFRPGGGDARPMSTQDIELMRTRLAVPDAQRAVWDALGADLLQASAAWMKTGAGNGTMPATMPAPGQTPEQFMQARAARRAELARIEDAWFDNVKAGVQGVDAATLETTRARRALQRALGSIRAGGVMMPDVLMSRWLRVDLDKAADALSPAGRANAAVPLQAWRAEMLTELAATQTHMDDMAKVQMTMMQSETVTDDQGHTSVRMSMNMDQTQGEAMQRAREPLQAAWKRVEQAQSAGANTVAAALPESDANAFRRAVRKQTHPEAFRSQEKVDAAIARVMNLPDLSPEQLQSLGALTDAYRDRSDGLVDHSIQQADRNDTAVAGLMEGDPTRARPDQARLMQRVRAMESTDRTRGDATYDREELNARTLRQLRAALTPQQAQAAKLN